MQRADRTRRLALGLGPVLLLFTLFLIFPMIGLIRASFFPGSRSFGEASGFSLEQYQRVFVDNYYFTIFLETVWIGLVTAFICLILAFPVAYSVARLSYQKRRWRLIAIVLPLTLSLVVVVFGWIVILGRNGVINDFLVGIGILDRPARFLYNWWAVVIVLVQQFLPFMILSIMSVCAQIDIALEEAAASLRANRLTTFRRVIIPLALPGILAGYTLVFILAASAFITPRMVGGGRIQMVGNLILEQVLVLVNWPFGSALGFLMLIGIFAMTVILNVLFSRVARGHSYAR